MIMSYRVIILQRSDDMNKRESTISGWAIIKCNEYYKITGQIFNDDRWPDGTPVVTSMVQKIDFTTGYAETLNTIYKLV